MTDKPLLARRTVGVRPQTISPGQMHWGLTPDPGLTMPALEVSL
jgi:hypothetical protein